jgi:hypothetical protein
MLLVLVLIIVLNVAALAIVIRSGLPAQVRKRTEERDAILQAVHDWSYSTSFVGSNAERENRRLYTRYTEVAAEAGWTPPDNVGQAS